MESRRKTPMGEPGIRDAVRKWVAGGKRHEDWCRDRFLAALENFCALKQAFGWKPLEELFAEYRTLPQAERPKDDAAKRDQAVRLSRITGQKIAAVFDA